jgi:hypothetical protein
VGNIYQLTFALLLAGLVCVAAAVAVLCRRRHMDRWIGAYVQQIIRRTPRVQGTTHLLVCVCDHYEPAWNGVQLAQQHQRVATWVHRLPVLASRHRDAENRPFQYTFFYPEEQYREEHLDQLARICHGGYGDVEIHLHHDDDTADGVAEKLTRFATLLHQRHGLLRADAHGRIAYGFIHGDWALDNCAAGGAHCGVNNEIQVLRDTGCYADFTLPSAPSETQTRTINSIYYATDDPDRPYSHNTGVRARVGGGQLGDLLLIQGPLTLNWRRRSKGVLPRIENGELSGDNPPTPQRADLWVRQGIHVEGRPEWVFIKLHAHGANESNMEALLGSAMNDTLTHLEKHYDDGHRYALHYVTAREMYCIVKAAEAGETGNPGELRRFGETAVVAPSGRSGSEWVVR